MKKLVLLALVVLPVIAFSQKAVVEFEKTDHDFGNVQQSDGNAVYDFVFLNTGDAPLILTNVKASCGCTTPVWTKDPVAPGQKGTIKVSYDAGNRPGGFNKSITVSSNAEVATVVLTIRGNVIPKTDPVG